MSFDHNPDKNPDWSPKMAYRVYACCKCGTEHKMSTNHTGTVWNARCKGSCRTILNPHTAREVVLAYHGPHEFKHDAE